MSPIESQLLKALRVHVPDTVTLFDCTGYINAKLQSDGTPGGTIGDPDACGDQYGVGDEEVWIWRAVAIDSYRVDFLLSINGLHLAVECDGHEWHERTKQQAAYDRARDRDLLKQNITTIRFTGSEIHHSPERCAADVYAVVGTLSSRFWAEITAWNCGHSLGKESAEQLLGCRPDEHW